MFHPPAFIYLAGLNIFDDGSPTCTTGLQVIDDGRDYIGNPTTSDILPDLQTLPPFDLRLVYDPESKRLILRFGNSIWNAGPGNLELKGAPDITRKRITVSQTFHDIDGNPQEPAGGRVHLPPPTLTLAPGRVQSL
jgi:hypothetical protein